VIQAAQLGIGGGGRVLVRPQCLLPDPAALLRARVESVVFRGPGSSGWVRLAGGARLELDFGPDQLPEIGTEIGLVWHDPAPVRFAD
ncbi:MAG: TOBE domain-containing protein, partial [Stenotrophomonas sp.]